jgi:tight adherence protein C
MSLLSPLAVLSALGCAVIGLLGLRSIEALQRASSARRLARVIRDDVDVDVDVDAGGLRLATRAVLRWVVRHGGAHSDPELRQLLTQRGWRGPEALGLFVTGRRVATLVAVTAALAFALLGCPMLSGPATALACFAAGVVAYLAPKLLLAHCARRRIERIRDDVSTCVQLLRVLLEAGLSLEQCLRVLVRDAQALLPELHFELELAVQEIGAGRERNQVLRALAQDLRVPELSDLARLLAQSDLYGGSLQAPLSRLSELVIDRQRTDLQERVARLSARMTFVTLAFLLPALLVFVGDPGVLAFLF